MASPYEVEHNIKPTSTPRPHRRRPDMSTFDAHLRTLSSPSSVQHNNPHAVPNPVDTAAAFRLIQDQFGTLASDAPTESNRDFLLSLVEALDLDVAHPPREIEGVSQEYLDGLERVDRSTLKEDDTCPICAEKYLDDKYCLVVELPCHGSHKFDLECVGPWLRGKGTCPMCRKELGQKKKKEAVKKEEDEEEEDDMDGLYS
ncbi:hypothetical protein QBC35DRAFT_503388 [Podospora australis]|uniref:RING-type domain-containing protein n=1 Tax=Podospora australis TaxID=1536484 RepID=A0AAN6WP70_9PEZI|nr:hypothetical protein QBC35DRAFT_503388 [Podospora australis]